MKEKKYESTSCTSNLRYKSIDSLDFVPMKRGEVIKVVSKGQRLYWKWLGLIPLIPYKAKNDLYYCSLTDGYNERRYFTLDEMRRSVEEYEWLYMNDNNEVFVRAKVKIHYTKDYSGSYNIQYFTSDKEAMNFYDELKKKCKDCGNELR